MIATVLVVEDDPRLQVMARKVLERSGYTVVTASDGEEGVRLAAAQHPAVILMDVSLPGIDGLEATRRIKTANPGQPIVACTAHAMTGDRERIMAAGCDDFLSKPYMLADLVGKIAHFAGIPAPAA